MAERGERGRRAAEVAALDTRRAKEHADRRATCSPTGPPGRRSSASGARELEATLWRGRAARAGPRRARAAARRAGKPAGPDRPASPPSPAPRCCASCARAPALVGGPARWARRPIAFLSSESGGAACSRPSPTRRPATPPPSCWRPSAELLAGAIARQAAGAGLVDEPIVEAVLARHPELSDEQAAMVRGPDRIRRRPAGGAGPGRLGQDLRPRSCAGGLGGRGLSGDRRRPVGAGGPGAAGRLGHPLPDAGPPADGRARAGSIAAWCHERGGAR